MRAELSVVVPTFQGERFLASTLDSLGAQKDVDLEVIVVDDGSTDRTADIAGSHPAVRSLVRQPNRGVAAARNRGMALASAPNVAFIDQDDLWHPERSRILLDLIREERCAVVGTTERAFARVSDKAALESVGDGRHTWPSIWVDDVGEVDDLLSRPLASLGGTGTVERLDVGRVIESPVAVTTAFLYDREAAITAGGCATWVKAADDHVLNVCVSQMFGPIVRVDVPCLFYRVHPASTSTVSPLVAPYLSMLLALRWGRVLPGAPVAGDYVRHLLDQMARSTMTRSDQIALLSLTLPPERRRRAMLRWAKLTMQSVRRVATSS